MDFPLKYSTASQQVPLGYFLDTSTGNVEQTGLTIANTDIKIWKSGATTLANKNSGGATHISNGIYYCVLDATDTNTYGPLEIFVHISGALAFHKVCTVMNVDAYSMLMSATPVTLVANSVWNAQRSSYTSTGTFGEGVNVYGSVTIDEVVDDIWDELTAGHTSTGTTGKALIDASTGGSAPTVEEIRQEMDSNSTKLANLDAKISSTGLITWANITRTITGGTIDTISGAPTIGDLVDGVWDEMRSSHTSTGTFGEYVNTATSGSDAATIWAYANRTLSGTQSFTLIGNISGSVASVVGNVGGNVIGSVGSVAGNISGSVNNVVGAVGSVAGNVSGSVASVVNGVTVITNNDKTGYSLSSTQSYTLIGNISGSVASVIGNVGGNVLGTVSAVTGNVVGSVGSVVNGATLTQINSLVSGIRGSDNDDLKILSDQLDGISVSSTTPSAIWSYSGRTLSGTQSFNIIGDISGSISSVIGSVGSVAGNVSGSVGSILSGVTVTTNNDKTGYSVSSVGDKVGYTVSTVQDKTGYSVSSISDKTGYSLSSLQTFTLIGNISGSVGSVVGAVGSVAGSVGSVAGNVSGSVASVAGNVSGSVASVVNGATLTQINSLVSGIRGSDNDDLKIISDAIDNISISGSTPSAIWSYSERTLTSTGAASGSATLAKQEEILTAIEDVTWGGYGQ